MIQVIGIKRIITIIILLAVNAVLAAAIYMYIIPEQLSIDTKLNASNDRVKILQSDINQMQVQFDQLKELQGRFDELKSTGFFSIQDRGDAKDLFSKIQNDSKVISAVVSVKPGITEDHPEAGKINHKILLTHIEVDIEAFDDNDIYRYIDMVKESFPGHISLEGISMNRTKDVSAALLRSIASGANPELVHAKVTILWRTLIPDSQVIPDASKTR